ncbi:uncharacterized protein LOC128202543 [Galleria mellonella]|uniref:Uncharacterized protein LOC128202543 n=1 Tax=Galleria mellonella TaxID=7137 RepID=A0ABM3N6Y4_GALME|nr:uncharacterized protein LOC128202543 [Galleria mellonella]
MESLIHVQNDFYTRINKTRANFKKSPKGRITEEYVENRLKIIEELWSEFKSGHKELYKLADPSKLKLHSYVTDEVYYKMEEVYLDHKCELIELLKSFIPKRSDNEYLSASGDNNSAGAKSSHNWRERGPSCPSHTSLVVREFLRWTEHRRIALEFIEPNNSNRRSDSRNLVQNSVKTRVLHANVFEVVCEYCAGNHKLCFCKEFSSKGYDKRHEFVANNRICFNCLGSNHSVRFCQKATNCRICKKRHHSLLHPPNMTPETINQGVSTQKVTEVATTNNENEPTVDSIVTCLGTSELRKQVLLATALVKVKSSSGQYQVVRALIDQGSQASFITEDTLQELGLKRSSVKGIISGLSENNSSVTSQGIVLLKILSMFDPTFKINVTTHVLKQITSRLPAKQIAEINWIKSANITLADPQYDSPNKIDLLLGAEVYSQILQGGIMKNAAMKNAAGSTLAQRTSLGWILSGSVECTNVDDNIVVLHSHIEENDMLNRFSELKSESMNSSKKMLTPEEEQCERIFTSTTKQNKDCRYIVKLPLREDDTCEGGKSRKTVVEKFKDLEKRFKRDNELKKDYTKVNNEYLTLNHMKMMEQPDDEVSQSVYSPHHTVVRKKMITTKMRVVFDGSCKNKKGISFNGNLLISPKLQLELRHFIIRWMHQPISLTADIIKMCKIVKVTDKDTNYQHMVWRENIDDEIRDYKLLTVTFGTSSVPYLTVRAMNQVVNGEKAEYPLASRRVNCEFYMNDLKSRGQTIEKALKFYYEMNALLNKGGFILQKWYKTSNKDQLNEMINKDNEENRKIGDIKGNVKFKTDNVVYLRIKDNFSSLKLIRVLNLAYSKEDDLPSTKWLFGRIVQKHSSTDNTTRVISLKYKRLLLCSV